MIQLFSSRRLMLFALRAARVDQDTAPKPPPQNPPAPAMREVNVRELMGGEREIILRLGSQAYRLSLTRAGKLILRK